MLRSAFTHLPLRGEYRMRLGIKNKSAIYFVLRSAFTIFATNTTDNTTHSMKRAFLLLPFILLIPFHTLAQERYPHASQWMRAVDKGVALPYIYDSEGITHTALFGMDTAWDSESNVRRGTLFIGNTHLSTGRISFQPDYFVNENGELTESQKSALRTRINHIKLSGVTEVEMNCDHEAMATTNYQYKGKPEEWYKVIKASVRYAQSLGMNVVAVAPFNEPDYSGWNEGSKDDFRTICQLLSEDSDFSDIRISAGNTLNTDRASEWYNYMKPYVKEGNTHQLAGSFDNYASFFEQVRADGNHATNDELHNVMEGIVGLEYGMQTGIWWGFDALARGNFCKANTGSGSRLGYAENREAWSAGAIYRLPDGHVNAILGTSERQATNSTYQLLSLDGNVYYDGWGPMAAFSIALPGGTGYQQGQTSAERCIQIVRGPDVPPLAPLEGGTFVIMNKNSRKVIGVSGNNALSGKSIIQQTYDPASPKNYHHWKISPVSNRVGGDFSYAYISNADNDQLLLDVKDWSLGSGGQIILWSGDRGTNEQWYFEYAGDGDFFIRSRHSSHCLEVRSSSMVNGAMIQQGAFTGADNQRWRLLPIGTACETNAPAAPTGLAVSPRSHSFLLSWNTNTEDDLAGYDVLRGEAVGADSISWNVIGRSIDAAAFVDNSAAAGIEYHYQVKAVDKADNRSEASATVIASLTDGKGLVARYPFDDTLIDTTPQEMDAVSNSSPTYQSVQKREGKKSLYLEGNTYLQLPPKAVDMEELTLCVWIYWQGGTAWQRIFDFGNGTDQYLFLTPSNGSEMRLVAKNGGEEEILGTDRLSTYHWKHVAVVLGKDEVTLYIDGEPVAQSQDFSIRPSDFHPMLNFIGCSQFAKDPNFKGCIDDLRIYDYALNADEVASVIDDTNPVIDMAPYSPSVVKTRYYSPDGVLLSGPRKGINIVEDQLPDGKVRIHKIIGK